MQQTELLYDVSVNDMFGQYVFWIADFDVITAIPDTDESDVKATVDKENRLVTLTLGDKSFLLHVSDETLLDKLIFDGVMLVISVPDEREGELTTYAIKVGSIVK